MLVSYPENQVAIVSVQSMKYIFSNFHDRVLSDFCLSMVFFYYPSLTTEKQQKVYSVRVKKKIFCFSRKGLYPTFWGHVGQGRTQKGILKKFWMASYPKLTFHVKCTKKVLKGTLIQYTSLQG